MFAECLGLFVSYVTIPILSADVTSTGDRVGTDRAGTDDLGDTTGPFGLAFGVVTGARGTTTFAFATTSDFATL